MEIKLSIPTSLSEITLKQYRDFMLLNEEDEVKYFKSVANIFCTGNLEHIDKFPQKELKKAFENFIQLLTNQESKLILQFTIDKVKYGFIPKISDITVGELADIETYIEKGFWQNIHKILAVLYRPINQEFKGLYNIESYTGTGTRADLFLHKFPIEVLNGCLVFFWIIEKQLTKHLILSSAEKNQKIKLFKINPQ